MDIYNFTEYKEYTITSDELLNGFTVYLQGEEFFFNTLEEAKNFIDQL